MEPSAPGGRPSARLRRALGRPLMCPLQCRQSGDGLAADRIAVRPVARACWAMRSAPSRPLWVPRIRGEVRLGLGFGLLDGPSFGLEGLPSHRAEAALMGERRQGDGQPSPNRPTTLSTGTTASLKKTSLNEA